MVLANVIKLISGSANHPQGTLFLKSRIHNPLCFKVEFPAGKVIAQPLKTGVNLRRYLQQWWIKIYMEIWYLCKCHLGSCPLSCT